MPFEATADFAPIAAKKRQDTKLEAEGAEFMVLGMLLIEGIHCFKAYTNFAGYDLVALNPQTKKQATDYDNSFPFENS